MNKITYQKLVKELTPKDNKLLNSIISFITGGLIGVIGTLIYNLLNNYYSEELSISFMLLILITIISFLTAIGCGDNLFSKLKCGIIIPITGFSHSIASCIIDYKKEGLLNIGSNAFKLAGSVIVYGTISAIVLALIKVTING